MGQSEKMRDASPQEEMTDPLKVIKGTINLVQLKLWAKKNLAPGSALKQVILLEDDSINTDDFLIKARKSLSDNGYFYLITPNLASYHGRLSLLLGYTPAAMDLSTNEGFFGKFCFLRYKDAVHHIRVFTYRAIREMCTYYGFEVKTAIGIDSRLPGIFKHFPGIAGSVCLKMTKSK